MRIGHGYDVHRLTEGRKLILGGVEIPYEKGLLGHSDADVLVHAVMDALTGAARLGDIGKLFPDNDEAFRNISSMVLLKRVGEYLRQQGYAVVCGCDEAGAGPLMGPVCAGAVILPPGCDIPGLDDSKKLTEKKREALFDVICQQAAAWAVASVSAEEIDATDILSARMKAMQLAIDALAIPADYALIDGNRDHGRSSAITTPHETVVGGDCLLYTSDAADE